MQYTSTVMPSLNAIAEILSEILVLKHREGGVRQREGYIYRERERGGSESERERGERERERKRGGRERARERERVRQTETETGWWPNAQRHHSSFAPHTHNLQVQPADGLCYNHHPFPNSAGLVTVTLNPINARHNTLTQVDDQQTQARPTTRTQSWALVL